MSSKEPTQKEPPKLKKSLLDRVRYDHILLAFLAAIIGVTIAYAAIGFRELISLVQYYAYGTGDERMVEVVRALPWWQIVLTPIVGGLIVAVFQKLFADGKKPESVADVIEANALRDGKMSWKTGLTSALMTATSLGVGASAGREGPVVHMGASLASFIAQKLNLTPAVTRTLLACGVASAVSASFNAPIAGVFFALEVVMGHYAVHTFAPVVIAGVAGTMVSRAHFGDFPAFIIPDITMGTYWELPAFAILGIVASLVAIAFSHNLILSEKIGEKLPMPNWLLPPVGGLIVGLIALKVPEILGVGYEAVDNTLKGSYELQFLLVLLVAKIIATGVSVGFRFGGGVFGPSLFLGAMTGGAFGLVATSLFPDLASDPNAYAIVGMGAVASSVLGAPVSTILIVFELTGDYAVTIAVMVASSISALATGLMHKPSLFYWMLERKGLYLAGGKALHLLKSTTVREIIDRNFMTVRLEESIDNVREMLLAQYGGKLLVTDEDGSLYGIITSTEISKIDEDSDVPLVAANICLKNPMTVLSTDILETALEKVEASGEEAVPVIEDLDGRIVVGFVHITTLLRTYNAVLVEMQSEVTDVKKRL
jgi:CIC family chloride channel protein